MLLKPEQVQKIRQGRKPQFVDQEGDVINYSIVITNKSKAKQVKI